MIDPKKNAQPQNDSTVVSEEQSISGILDV